MVKLTTVTCASGTTDFTVPVELGFVPTRVEILNRTTTNKVVWTNDTDTFGYLTTSTGTVTYVSAVGLTVIDGSDKVNYLTSSFGFLLPKITDVNDAAGEILDVVAMREDV